MLAELEMFVALANEAHFGRAAERCGVTQPSLSAAIKRLEDQLGVRLVERGSRYRGLTPEGRRAIDWAHRIVADARALRDDMRSAREGIAGHLRLAVIPTALAMTERLTRPLLARSPGLTVEIRSSTAAEAAQRLDGLDADAAITYLGTPSARRVEIPLYAERYYLLSRGAGAEDGAIPWEEVAARPLCLLTEDMQNRRILDALMLGAGAGRAPRLTSNSVIALIAHVRSGGWETVLPEATAALFAGDPSLVSRPVAQEGAAPVVGLVATAREPQVPALAALLDAARTGP
ncbi:LysR family transcriptional regulator [Roseicyclus sp. F158]|uniref:LysR family transcriptional regulator n=1 Tax=Tropicimonas omnivorans TaxID=3075590 RepID=A0ABU3DFK2_9RHOB|nr:LysR family transcriptional regulator [Roseicyclus sp. F158]MDT0682496.1 LysR family transcriptional regulator [Roseicyclus sp. F158]